MQLPIDFVASLVDRLDRMTRHMNSDQIELVQGYLTAHLDVLEDDVWHEARVKFPEAKPKPIDPIIARLWGGYTSDALNRPPAHEAFLPMDRQGGC